MANRFPLIIDTADDNKIKELPTGDNLDLTGNGITGVGGITASGTITANSIVATNITVNGSGSLATVATTGNYNDLIARPVIFSGSWNDLTDKPAIFSGDYNDLVNKPTVPATTSDLTNDSGFITNSTAAIPVGQIVGLATVATSNSYDDLEDLPTIPSTTSELTNDADFVTLSALTSGTLAVEVNNSGTFLADDASVMLDSATKAINGIFTGDLSGSVFAGDSTLLVDAVDAKINLVNNTLLDLDISDGALGQVLTTNGEGSFSFENIPLGSLEIEGNTITTTDSSPISFNQGVIISDDLTVQNSLTVSNNINLNKNNSEIIGSQSIEISCDNELVLSAFRINSLSLLNLGQATTVELAGIGAQNGDLAYNTDTNKFQGYANGAWVDLH